jgi:cytochrome d ubiquinol oxidase subunit I
MMTLDAEILSRLQFAFTVSFHIVFPSMSIGLVAFLVLIEGLYLRTRDELYQRIYRFWAIIFAMAFGMGVVSGIVMSFEFGTNFSGFAQVAGPVIGPIIGLEVLTAFFLEAGFLGIMLFGWGRVSERMHFAATFLVSLGTTISAACIMAVNSWMQTPSGVEWEKGRLVVTDWWQVVFNPSFPYRFLHMMMAAWITAAFLIAGIAAYYLLKNRHTAFARRCFSIGLGVASILLPLQLFLGDVLAGVMATHQPAKVQAMEGFWETTPSAPYNLIIVPDQDGQRNRFQLGVPHLGSLLVTKTLHEPVAGLRETPRADQPRMGIVFYAFRVMFLVGTLMFCAAVYSLWLRYRRRLYSARLFLKLMLFLTPSGFLCVLGGWYTAETGRQPFVINGLLRTADSVSPVAPGAVLWSLTFFVIIYGVLLTAFLIFVRKAILRGPADVPLIAHPSGTVRRAFMSDAEQEGVEKVA